MTKNRFFKNTLGVQAEAIIAQFIDNSSPGEQPSHALFVANALAGAIAVFFSDTNLGVPAGGTSNAANANRSYFYAWKQADGTAYRSTDIPCLPTYKQVSYSAGTKQVSTVTIGGTVSTTQQLTIRITDTTPQATPYPTYEYTETVTVDVPTTLAAIAADINAEQLEPIVTAVAAGSVLTVTGIYPNATNTLPRTFTLSGFLSTSGSQVNDLSTFTFATTTAAVAPVGTYNDVKEFEEYFIEQNGGVLYAQPGTKASEFQTVGTTASSNVVLGINYGYLIVTATKNVYDNGATRGYTNKAYVIIALPTASVATLAAN